MLMPREHIASPSPQFRARPDLDLSSHPFTARRLQLPSCSDLLGLWRRSDRTFRIVGGRMDDAGAAAALSAVGHIRHRLRAGAPAFQRALVSAMALCAMARRQ